MAANPGGRVLGADLIIKRITRAGRGAKTGARRGLDLSSADLLLRSANIAPILTGDLIRSGRVVKRGSAASGSIIRIVAYGTDHAVFAHEEITPAGPRKLGPWSSQKPSTSDGVVGGHFLSRPFRRHKERYVKLISKHAGEAMEAGLGPL
jgi:hypothetical protein